MQNMGGGSDGGFGCLVGAPTNSSSAFFFGVEHGGTQFCDDLGLNTVVLLDDELGHGFTRSMARSLTLSTRSLALSTNVLI